MNETMNEKIYEWMILDASELTLNEKIRNFAQAVSSVSFILEDEVVEEVHRGICHFDNLCIPSGVSTYQLDFFTEAGIAIVMFSERLIQFVYPSGARLTHIGARSLNSEPKHLKEHHLLLGESEFKDALDEILAPVMEVK